MSERAVGADPGRRARLMAIKLDALVRDRVDGGIVPGEFGRGAALLAGTAAWVLVESPAGLGSALAWSLRHGAAELDVLAEDGTGTLARRAEAFAVPVHVWFVEGRTLLPAIAEPLPTPPPLTAAHAALVGEIEAAGAEAVVEHGVLTGEVGGLEVCRVVDVDGVLRLEVGIGAHDREAFQLLHGDRPAVEALTDVVTRVAEHRRPGAAPHALNRIGRERALRARLVAEPSLVGARSVRPVQPPVPRVNLKDAAPCVAVADLDDGPVGLVCAAGGDLEAVPYAVDARSALGLDRCLLVLPEADAFDVHRRLGAALREPIEVLPVVA